MDGRLDPTHGDEEQQGIGRTESTLQKRCFVLASQPRAALPVGSVRAAFVGLPGRLLHEGPPWLPIHRAGGLSSPNWAGEEEAAQDCPPHLQSLGIGDPLIPLDSWVWVGDSSSVPHPLTGWWGRGSGGDYLEKPHPAYVHMFSPLVCGGLGRVSSFMGFFSFVSSFAQLYFLPFCLGHLPFSFLPPFPVGSAGWHGCWPEPWEPGQWPLQGLGPPLCAWHLAGGTCVLKEGKNLCLGVPMLGGLWSSCPGREGAQWWGGVR